MDTAVWDRLMTMKVAGTMRRDAYLIENWNMFCSVLGSFLAFIFENAGNIIVDTGVTKKATRMAKFMATL